MCTVDLKDAYYLIPIHPCHRKYLRFCFNGKLYEWNCLPFGLSCAPWVFTKILKPVVSLLREKGLLSVVYLDDFLLLGRTRSECISNVTETVKLLECLGFIVNYKKSNLIPNQTCKYLGFVYNSRTMSLSLPSDKRLKLIKLANQFITVQECKIREFSKFIGSLVSAAPAIKYGFLYTKLFEQKKYRALRHSGGNYEAKMTLDSFLHSDISWWISKLAVSCNPIRSDTFDIELFTDASKTGWGAYCNGNTSFGFWSNSEKENHINELELLAVLFGLKCFARGCHNCNILCRVDNTTAIGTINRMGSVRFQNLNKIARLIWGWCEERNIYIFASYISSSENFFADKASRQEHQETEWSLENSAFQKVLKRFGVPDIDLFASRLNRKCKTFVSWKRDPEAFRVDAFTLNWSVFSFYAFPPFTLMLRTLQKIIKDHAEGVVVAPYWVSQPWYPVFLSLLTEEPLILEPSDRLLSFSGIPHPMAKHLSLVVGKLSGKLFNSKTYRKTQ
ncbi:uncharacterized protein LOC116171583 isoform X1 [Photinus pyralis]|uniref:uncharacterized protein LOC116171583 isoform X1 n=1 Tax=Photinus pyralis TaxID=7054 RepID=UPI0012674098|nr:uncharacterized protein LOC116171583 isoform X1 [Photinus pyralis]XP_031344365.1 uncharacterized protein LOC116171583 isoform X1 [Photinus pyralis]